ncbi:PSP1 domain-containing protein [Pelovirga terrestris]|uniref:Stage 0 sporulation family protein n=1 Tax=Pelovirga terrestris TaxID=2771352 RepID=A0A8J6QM91_9BACT|nr:stage 0 sporulation family protein [Pelovirga terrestris]MBD1399578.1 stage 0 sporulation family protein [Pelovirga terrestris]
MTQTLKLVSVSFHCAGKIFDFDARDLQLSSGDKVIVETERGRALGTVVNSPRETPPADAPPKLKSVLRLATEADLAMATSNDEKEKEAIAYCRARIRERGLDMKLVRAEYLFDGSKVLFYFTAEGRIDFRDLVRDLAQQLRTRIEMRQIGVRDEAKLVGGLGVCGRELCCSSYLRDFAPVSVKMAKAQGLALNPTKISGQCGRLLCCLAYEYENYHEMRKKLPKLGKKVTLTTGPAEVISLDIMQQLVTLSCPGGERCRMQIEALQHEIALAAKPQPAASPETPPQATEKPQSVQENQPAKKTRSQARRARQRREPTTQETTQSTSAPTAAAPKQAAPPRNEESPQDKPAKKRRRPRRRSNRPKNPDKTTS